MTKEQARAPPKKAANRAEVDACYMLDAFRKKLYRIAPDITKRLHMVPGGWRDMRLMQTKMDNLMMGLYGTFEPEKAEQIERMGQSVQVRLEFNRQVVRENDMILVDMEELGVLITASSEACKLRMCEPQECRKCQLGRVLDKLSWVSRDNRAWWEVFEIKLREETEEVAE